MYVAGLLLTHGQAWGAGAPWACTEWRGAHRDKHVRPQVPAQGGRAEVGSVSGGLCLWRPDVHMSADLVWVRPAGRMRVAAQTWTRSQMGHSLEIPHRALGRWLPLL